MYYSKPSGNISTYAVFWNVFWTIFIFSSHHQKYWTWTQIALMSYRSTSYLNSKAIIYIIIKVYVHITLLMKQSLMDRASSDCLNLSLPNSVIILSHLILLLLFCLSTNKSEDNKCCSVTGQQLSSFVKLLISTLFIQHSPFIDVTHFTFSHTNYIVLHSNLVCYND